VESSPVILFFDGECALCDGFVRFILDRDARARFRFAPLQSKFAAGFFEAHGWSVEGIDSVVLFREERFFIHSDAALEVMGELPGIWSLGRHLRVIPRPWRDALYRWVAAHRYRWFGRYEACRLPRPGESSRFLGDDETVS